MQVMNAADFLPCRFPQKLNADAIHLWFFPQWPGPLHAVARSPLLMAMLAAYAGVRAADLHIECSEHGKPRLRDVALEFNLSHSGKALLLGLSTRQPFGVDVEAGRRDRPVLALARRWFSAREFDALQALPERLRQTAFMRLWSCKEAVLKAHGRGIGYGLEHIGFDLDGDGRITGLHEIAGDLHSPAWQVRNLSPQDGVTGALAWCGSAHTVSTFLGDADHISNIAAGL